MACSYTLAISKRLRETPIFSSGFRVVVESQSDSSDQSFWKEGKGISMLQMILWKEQATYV